MISPRDPVPNYVTGGTVSERQAHHLDALQAAGEALLESMHWAEGSNPPGEHQEHEFQTRRMKIAATHLETALMFACKAAMEVR